MVDKNLLRRLAEVSGECCISLYLPKKRMPDNRYEPDPGLLGQLINVAKNRLISQEVPAKQVKELVSMLSELGKQSPFFHRYQPGVTAIFACRNQVEWLDLPLPEPEMVYVGQEFYLRPALGLLYRLDRFFLLSLSADQLYLFEGTESCLVQVANLMPQLAPTKPELPENEKPFFEDLFRRADERLLQLLNGEKAPLILAGPEWQTEIYRRLSRYPNVLESPVHFQPEQEEGSVLMPRLLPLLQQYKTSQSRAKRQFFIREMLRGNASIALADILSAAVNGKVATLFLDRNQVATGEYKPAIQWTLIDEKPDDQHTSLFNLAAIRTFLEGGEVYDLDRSDMPDETTSINATFR